MFSRKTFFSAFIVLAMLFAGIGFASSRVFADDTLPDISNAKLEDGILSFTTTEDCYFYYIDFRGDAGGYAYMQESSYSPRKVSLDCYDFCCQNGLATDNYTVSVSFFSKSHEYVAKKWTATYSFTCPGIELSTPSNIAFDPDTLTLSWDPGPNHTDTEVYTVHVERRPAGVTNITTVITLTTKQPSCSRRFLKTGNYDYTIQIEAKDPGNVSSDLSEKYVFTYNYQLPDLLDVHLSSKGILSWRALNGANQYRISLSADGSNLVSYDTTDNRCDLDEIMERYSWYGKTVSVSLVARALDEQDKVYFEISNKAEVGEYTTTTEFYPLKYYGNQIHSRSKLDDLNNDGGSLKYDPTTNTLIVNGTNFYYYSNCAIFTSSADLIIMGDISSNLRGTLVETTGKLTFAEGSRISLRLYDGTYPAFKAKELVINGTSMYINSEGAPMDIDGNITFGNACISAEFKNYEGNVSAVHTENGKIKLNKMQIQVPENGSLGKDSKNVYLKDGSTVASEVKLFTSDTSLGFVMIDETNFPDGRFRYWISKHLDTDSSGFLDKEELKVETIEIFETDMIYSMKGMEFFKNLISLSIVSDTLTGLDLSKNPGLCYLQIVDTPLKELDISYNPLLIKAYKEGIKEAFDDNMLYRYYEEDAFGALRLISELYIKNGMKINTEKPTPTPTKEPTKAPTTAPTKTPTKAPTKAPTGKPTVSPTKAPTGKPTGTPTKTPTKTPTSAPTGKPTVVPTRIPSGTPTKPVTPKPGDPTPTTAPGQPTPKPADPTPTTAPGQPTPKPGDPTPTTAPGNPTPKPGDPTPTPNPEKEPSIADFVERLYTIALNRPSEPEGKAFWVNEIESGNRTGGDCAHFFLIEAPEFLNRGLNEEDFVETLYLTFFDRASEPAGKKFWVDGLKSGKLTKENVIMGFIDSTEWCNVCATYGVKSGAPNAKAEFASKNAIKFATRLYTCCLGRDPEEGGLKYWSLALTNLEQTGCSAAKNFFTSDEFVNFKLKDDEYVRRLYTTFMGRDPEASEVAYWVGEIAKGTQTKDTVMAFFGQSEEFTNICKKYGIDRGTI